MAMAVCDVSAEVRRGRPGFVTVGFQQVEIVANRQVSPDADAIRLAATPSVEIGSVSGEGGADFTVISSITFISDELFAVVDNLWREVRLFDLESGRLQSTLGGPGNGPGEFSAAPTIAVSPSGGVWAWDPGNRRVYEFAVDGALQSSRALSGPQAAMAPMNTSPDAWIVTPSGAVISISSKWNPVGDEQRIVLMDPNEADPVMVGDATRRRVEADPPYVLPNPFRALRQVTSWTDGLVVSSPADRWEITVFDLDGGPLRRVQLPLQGPEVHGEVFDTERRYYLTRYPKTPELLELLDGFRSVRRASAIGGILSAGDGNLWVRRWRSRTPTAPDYFDVINAEGTWVSTVAIPAEYGRLAAISASRAICVWLDDYDVPHLRVYSLVKEPRD